MDAVVVVQPLRHIGVPKKGSYVVKEEIQKPPKWDASLIIMVTMIIITTITISIPISINIQVSQSVFANTIPFPDLAN